MTKILIIEDERRILRVVRDALEEKGFTVAAAGDGPTGLAIALKEDIALVVLDLLLPGENGLEVCRKIKRKKITIPIIMLTALAKEADKITGLEYGADDYMTKPFSVKELIARIHLVHDPFQSGYHLLGVSHNRAQEVRKVIEDCQLHPLRVYHHEFYFFRRAVIQEARDYGIYADGLSGACRPGYQEVRHPGEVRYHGRARDVLSQRQLQLRLELSIFL